MNFKKIKKSELLNMIENLKSKVLEKCPKCGAPMKSAYDNRAICSENLCKFKKQNIWTNTLFEKTRKSKIKILRILELWMQKMSIKNISYVIGTSRQTIWNLLLKVKKRLIPNYYNSLEQIGGNNLIVEIDESKFGKRKYNRGHKVEGVWVLGLIEKTGDKRIILFILDDRKKETLNYFIQNSVKNDSTIRTDCWKGYVDLKFLFNSHQTVNHSICFKDKITGVHTNTIEGSWYGVKTSIPNRGRTRDKIELYLCRYMILKNSKEHPLKSLIKYLF
jgi:transposase-like protein